MHPHDVGVVETRQRLRFLDEAIKTPLIVARHFLRAWRGADALACRKISRKILFDRDEPSQGLAPLVVRELARVIRLLCDAGVTILLIEQNMKLAEVVADELHIMVKGRMVYSASPAVFRAEEESIRARFLTV